MDAKQVERNKKEDAAIAALKTAMTSRDIEELEAAITLADEARLRASESDEARKILVGEKGGGLLWVNHPGQRSFEIEWESDDTVADLKKAITQATKVPFSKQVLRSGGAPLGEDFRFLKEIAATRDGKQPEVWLFDERDREDILADSLDEAYFGDEGPDVLPGFGVVFPILCGVVPFVYVVTQIFGVNPFEPEQAGTWFDLGGYLGLTEPMEPAPIPSQFPSPQADRLSSDEIGRMTGAVVEKIKEERF